MSANQLATLVGPFYGSFYFGAILSTAFYGVTCMQTFFYYVHYPDDPLGIKIFVAILWAINTVHEGLSVAGVYKYILAGLLNPLSIVDGFPELVLLYLFTVLAAIPTQGFLVYRIYILSQKNIMAPLIWVPLALVQLVTAIINVAKALYSENGAVHALNDPTLGSGSFAIQDTVILSVAAGADVLIAILMTFLLIRERSVTDIANTAHILQRLIVFAVNTGTWTATFALLTIILLHIFPSNLIYTVFGVPLCTVYCNTVLANLNARAYVRGETSHVIGTDLSTSSSSGVSDNTGTDNQPGEMKLVCFVPETTEGGTFLDPNQFASSAAENTEV